MAGPLDFLNFMLGIGANTTTQPANGAAASAQLAQNAAVVCDPAIKDVCVMPADVAKQFLPASATTQVAAASAPALNKPLLTGAESASVMPANFSQ